MAADNTSMSVLGQFYDALIAASEDQGKKYGNSAKPDFVPGVVSDAFAEGIVAMGASLSAANVATYAANNATDYAFGKFTIGKLNLNSLMPINIAQIAPTQTFSQGSLGTDTVADGDISGATGEGLKAELKVEYSNPNDIILDPRKTIDKAVDSYKEQLIKIRNAKMWAGAGEVAQKAASYFTLKSDGVPNDVAAAIINAGVKDPEGIVFEQAKRMPDKDKKGATAPIEGWPEAADFPKRESKPFIPFNASKVDNVFGTSMGMFAGITDVEGRAEFAEHVKNELMPKATESYNLRSGGAGRKGENFFDLFAESSGGKNVIASSRKDQLFDPSMGGNSTGDLLQTSLLDVLGRQATDASLSPRLRGNLTALYNKISDEDQAFGLFQSLGKSMGKGTFKADGGARPMDLTPAVQLGVKSLAGQVQSGGNSRLASSLMGAADRMTAYDGKLSPMEQVGYMAARWNSIPAMDKWISPAMVIMGDAGGFSQLVNGLGGLRGSGPINATKPWVGLEMMNVFGKDNAKAFKLSSEKGEDSNGLMKWAYGVPKGMTDANDKPVFKKDAAGNIVKDRHGNPIQLMDMNYDTTLSQWGRINWVVSANSNQLQKAAYAAYVFHPVNIVKGALNGSLGEHLMWMGSGHGRMFENKDFSKVFKDKAFGDMLRRQNRKEINKFKEGLMQKYNATGDKNYLRAHRVTRVMDFMNRPKYKAFVNGMEKIHKVIGLPGQIQKKAMELAKRAALKLAMKVAAKIGAQVLLESVLAAFTAGASLLLTRGYAIANAVTFGLLDKIVFGTIKFTLELVVAIALGIFGLLLVTGGVLLLSGQILLVGGLGMGGGVLWPPNPDYVPILADYDTSGGSLHPPGEYPFPGECEDFKDLTCPFTFTSGVYCSQAPYGNGSHSCAADAGSNPYQNRYAVDISGPTKLIAPEDGNVVYVEPAEICGGDPNGAYVIYEGSVTGSRYVFAHLELGAKLQGKSGAVSVPYKEGEQIAQAAILQACIAKGGCSCWHGQHIHAYIQGTTAADVIYGIMCGGSVMKCSLNCTPDCKTCGANIVPSMPAVCDDNQGGGGGGGGGGAGGTCKGYTSGVAGSYTQAELESGNIGAGTCNNSLPDSQFGVPGVDKNKFIEIAEAHRIWQIAAEVPAGSGKTPNLARECYNYVVCKSRQAGVNPAFSLIIWMHESAASNYTFFGIGSRVEDMGIHCYAGTTAAETCACGTTAANNLKAQIEMFDSLTHYDCGRGLEGWASMYGKGTCNSNYGVGYVAELKQEWSWFSSLSAFPTWTKDTSKAEPGLNCDAAWVPRP